MSKKDNRNTIIGAVLVAAIVGALIGAVIFHNPGEPLPSPPKVEFGDEYDDSWGKLDKPVERAGVTHILIKIDANRKEADAKKEIEQIQAYMRRVFGNPAIRIVARPMKKDSAEVYIGEDFTGVMFRDDEDGELSYNFTMAILSEDLAG